MKIKSENSGFTLIELLVVMSIIAILSGVSLFALQGARESGQDARRKSDLEEIRSALQLYKADVGTYLSGSLPSGSLQAGGNTYLQDVPEDPVSGDPYLYSGGGTTYCLCAILSDPPATTPCTVGAGNYCVQNP